MVRRSLIAILVLVLASQARAQNIGPGGGGSGGGGGGPPSGSAGGALAGSYPNPGLNAGVAASTLSYQSITPANVNNIYNPQTYGAAGIGTPITCTSTGSGTLTSCSSTAGWASGTYVYALLIAAGSANTLSAPGTPVATNALIGSCGTGSSTTYAYEIQACKNDSDGAVCSAPSAASNTATAACPLFPGRSAAGNNLDKNTLSGYTVSGAVWYRIFRSVNSGPYNLLDETTSTGYVDYGQPGWDQSLLNFDVPATPPASAQPATYEAQVTAVTSNTLTVTPAPTQTGTITIYHDDSPAWRAAVAAAAANGGGTVQFPPGNYIVPIDNPIPPSCAVCFNNSVVLLPNDSNITITGPATGTAILTTGSQLQYKFAGNPDVMMEINGSNSAAQFPPNLSYTNVAASAPAGQSYVNVASVSAFNVGDYILVHSGNNDPFANNSNPDSEVDQVASIDSTNEVLNLKWPLEKSYQQQYWIANGNTGLTALAPLWAQGVYSASNSNLVTCATNCPSAAPTIFAASVITAGGATGASEPDWATSCPSVGNTCTDGQVTWKNIGTAASQAAIFGVTDMTPYLTHDIVIRGLVIHASQGGVSTGGVYAVTVTSANQLTIEDNLIDTADLLNPGFTHAINIVNNPRINFLRSGGGGDSCCAANGVTDEVWDNNTITGQQPFAFQLNEGATNVRFTNNTITEPGFPEYPNAIATLGGAYTQDLTVSGNRFCGHAGAGVIGISSGAHTSQSVDFSNNTIACPYGPAFPDFASLNSGGSANMGNPDGSSASGNTYLPSGAWNGVNFTGVIGSGHASTGQRNVSRTCGATINYSQGALTPTPICTLSTNDVISGCKLQVTNAFTAGSNSAISLGYPGSPTDYSTSQIFNTSGPTVVALSSPANFVNTPAGNAANNLTAYYSWSGTTPTVGTAILTCEINAGYSTTAPAPPPGSFQIGASGTGNTTPAPHLTIHTDYTPDPEGALLGVTAASNFDIEWNTDQTENSDGTWDQNFNSSSQTLSWKWTPHSGSPSTIMAVSGDGKLEASVLGQLSANSDSGGTLTLSSATSIARNYTTSHVAAPVCTVGFVTTTPSSITACGAETYSATASQLIIYVQNSCSATVSYVCVGNPD